MLRNGFYIFSISLLLSFFVGYSNAGEIKFKKKSFPSQKIIIDSNVLFITFPLKYKDRMCSSFAVSLGDDQYMITAKHTFKDIKKGDEIYIFHQRKWWPFKADPVYCEEEYLDLVAFLLPQKITYYGSNVKHSSSGIIISQDIYFLGFPFGLSTKAESLFPGATMPFVKKGCLSSIQNKNIFVDGISNPGFSGGPIIFEDIQTKELKILGVVSGYRKEKRSVIVINKSSNLYIEDNTGILVGTQIEPIISAINKRRSK